MTAPDLTHSQIEELLGAFALDAVENDERDLIDAHLVGCPRCQHEVSTYRETAAMLAHGGSRAPEGVWARIAESLEEAPPALDLTNIVAFPTGREAMASGPGSSASQRRPRRSITLRRATAVAAIAAAVTAVFGVRIGQQDQNIREVQEQVAVVIREDGLRRAALLAQGDPEAEQLWLKSFDGTASANLVRLDNGTGFLLAENLAPLPADRTYQLWGLRRDAKVSLAVLGNDPEVASFQMVGDVFGYAITEEAAGGVGQSTNTPSVIGWLPGGEEQAALGSEGGAGTGGAATL